MSNEDFAALIATMIVGERQVTTPTSKTDERDRFLQNFVISVPGIVVSGRYLQRAKEQYEKDNDLQKIVATLLRYKDLGNITADNLATVGIGNMWIKTAAEMWKGQACNPFHECVPVKGSPLMTTDPGILGLFPHDVAVANPFADAATEKDAWLPIAKQLLDEKTNIEYISANVERGMLRAKALGLTPSSTLAAWWHSAGVLTPNELVRLKADPDLWNKDPRGYATTMSSWQPKARGIMDFAGC